MLADVEIKQALDVGDIAITPFDLKMLQPASYDLKVGRNAATVPTNGDPRVDLEKAGVLLIPPYAPAVVYTREELRLSNQYVGHFGLKSKLARRGLNAAVGIQIDPGFQGPLSVTLQNLTPTPLTLSYGEDFLTLEIDRLSVPASRGYGGEYQGRTTFTGSELEPVLGFKGHALTDVVKGFDDVRDAVKVVAEMSHKIEAFMTQHQKELRVMREFNAGLMKDMKRLVEHIVGEREATIVLRTLSHDEAREEILELFRLSNGPLYYSDIAERLQLDLEQVLAITTELEHEGLIGERDSHGSKGAESDSQ